MRLRFFMLAAVAVMLATAPAEAQNADAVAHFKRGKELRDGDKCKEAIPEFKESVRIEESIGGFYNLGFCHEKLGNKQEAFEAYTRARDMAKKKNDDRLREIGASRDVLLQTSPHVTLTLPETLPAGLAIKVDGKLVPPSYYSPGETVIFTERGGSHVVAVSAPGYDDHSYTITDEKAVPVVPQRTADKVTPPPPAQRQEGWMWQHWAGLGAVVVGTGLAVFTLANFIAYNNRRSKLQDRFDAACIPPGDMDPTCTPQQAADQKQARTNYDNNELDAEDRAPLWIGVGIGGGVLIIGGVAVILLAPIGVGSPKTVGSATVQLVPQLGLHTQGLGLSGTF